jgi:ParB family chromosome partitioning protein
VTNPGAKPNGQDTRPGKRKALGKGLEALIPSADPDPWGADEFFYCEIEHIRPNRYQPRANFNEEEMAELIRSVTERGILQPLIVRGAGEKFELVAGERRLRAARAAGLTQVPVVRREITDEDLLALSLIENIQRENLNPIEEAEAYHQLMTRFGLTQEQVSDRVGKKRSTVANFLRLRSLPEPIKADIVEGAISMGHARAILGAETPDFQLKVWRAVTGKGLSVRETERLVKRWKTSPPAPSPPEGEEGTYFRGLAEDLTRRFGTKVTIRRKGKKGYLAIEFLGDEDLDRLLSLFHNL